MCGIAGYLTLGSPTARSVERMIGSLVHRGPDDAGTWIDSDAGVGLGHRRLSIVDLSPAGHEPMVSASGRFVVTYNGEIYNHQALRSELEAGGIAPEGGWRGHSDIETFLQAIDCWGLDRSLEKAVGMFAFGLWDRKARTLSLVRDRFGEKPLYYGWVGKDFLFGSELKALRSHPNFDNEIDRSALRDYASRTYVPAPRSIYRRIFKLLPGTILEVERPACSAPREDAPGEGAAAGGLKLRRYWSYQQVVEDGLASPIADEKVALTRLEDALSTAIRGQSIADVPIGAFLSGGTDSSLITALYQIHSSTPVRTFSIGFEEAGYNEAPHAKAVAAHLGTVHAEHYVSDRDASEVIPLLPQMYDEPFADSSQIPTYLVSKFARQHVTVALTGDGGDEMFGGYNRHILAPALWSSLERVPKPLRRAGGSLLGKVSPQIWSGAARTFGGQRHPDFAHKVSKGLKLAATADSYDDVLSSFLDEWAFQASPVLDAEGAVARPPRITGASDAVQTMFGDAIDYLPDDILCKVDRASMAVSLETRVPFLDHRLAALAARIPIDMKIAGRTGKTILRTLLYRHVPRQLIDRPKAGFAIPVGEWLRGPLRDWAEDLLTSARLVGEGYFDATMVRQRWLAHVEGKRDSTAAIWSILMFQAWLEQSRGSTR